MEQVQTWSASEAEVVLERPGVAGKLLTEDSGLRNLRISIDPASGIPPHVVANAARFYVIQGRGELSVGSTLKQLAAGDLVEIAAGASRGWHNPGPEPLELFVMIRLEGKPA